MNEQFFRLAVDSIPYTFVIYDANRRYQFVNTRGVKLSGYQSEAELLGRTDEELFPPEMTEKYLPTLCRAMETRTVQTQELEITLPAGTFAMEVNYVPVLDEQGEIRQVLGITHDITARKQAEDDLNRYARRLSTLHKIDQAILAGQSSAEIAEATLSQLRSLVPCRRVSIILFDYQFSEIIVLAAQTNGTVESGTGMRYPMEAFEGLDDILATLRQGKIYALDFMKFARLPPLIQTYQKEGLRYYLCLPLITQSELIGSLNLAVNRPDTVDPEHLAIAGEITRQLAVALQQRRLFEQVQTGREQLQILSRRLLEIQESERRLLARELHDEIGQALTAVKLNLQTLQRLPEKKSRACGLQESIGIVEGALQQVRNLSLDLRPSLLDDLGLGAALRWYADRQAQRGGFNVQVIVDLPEERLPADLETTCFRVAQEAITNVIRHARAHQVWVQAGCHQSALQLTIRDDGVGFDVSAARQRAVHGESLGLLSMEERVLLAGGKIDIESAPNRGTAIQVSLPLTPKQHFIERRTQRRKRR